MSNPRALPRVNLLLDHAQQEAGTLADDVEAGQDAYYRDDAGDFTGEIEASGDGGPIGCVSSRCAQEGERDGCELGTGTQPALDCLELMSTHLCLFY